MHLGLVIRDAKNPVIQLQQKEDLGNSINDKLCALSTGPRIHICKLNQSKSHLEQKYL